MKMMMNKVIKWEIRRIRRRKKVFNRINEEVKYLNWA